MRGAPVVVAALVAAALAGGGPVAAAAHPGGAAALAPGDISTVAGGTGGPDRGTNVALAPCDVSFADGHLYIADNPGRGLDRGRPLHFFSGAVREMSPASSLLTTVAGNHTYETFRNGGPATLAYLGTCGVTADHSGNVVISDVFDNRIRVVAAKTGTFYGRAMTAGHIYGIADVDRPGPVTVDAAGNVLFVDGPRIRVVAESTGTFYGQAMTPGNIYNVAGDGSTAYSGDFIPATSAGLAPAGEAVDAAGNLVIADAGNNRIRVVADSTGTFYGQAMTVGDIYTVAGGGLNGLGDGGPATDAQLSDPLSVAVDGLGDLVIGDSQHERVRVVAAKTGTIYGQKMKTGDIYTIAGDGNAGSSGDGGPATSAEFSSLEALTTDTAGNVVINDGDGRFGNVRVRAVAAKTGTFYGVAMKAGDIYAIAGNGIHGLFSGDGGPATSAELSIPNSVGVAPDGSMLIVGSERVRMVAGRSGTFYGQKMTAGDIYTVAGNGRAGPSGDGGLATRAELDFPFSVAAAANGNLLFCDSQGDRIRMVAAKTGTSYGKAVTDGDIYTLATQGCHGLAVDAAGNVVFSDFGEHIVVLAAHNGTFYGQQMTAGLLYIIAGNGVGGFSGDGGPATRAELAGPQGVGIDPAGNVVFADSGNQRIRVVATTTGTFYGQSMTDGDIYTIAGNGTAGYSGDGGPALAAEFQFPGALATDAAGNVAIVDSANRRIRMVAASTGSFYGQSMTAGDVYTVAGNGKRQFTPDGGPATQAALYEPSGVAVNAAGNLLISDDLNLRIRMVTR